MHNWTRFGLSTKLNLLTISLIISTAAGIAVYLVRPELREARAKLETEGVAILSLLSEAGEPPLAAGNKPQLLQILETLALNRNIAYAVATDRDRNEVVRRMFSITDIPAMPKYPASADSGRIQSTYVTVHGKKILELFAPVLTNRAPLQARTETIGYIRLGMSPEQVDERANGYITGALIVGSIVVLFGIAFTLLLTQRILVPVRK